MYKFIVIFLYLVTLYNLFAGNCSSVYRSYIIYVGLEYGYFFNSKSEEGMFLKAGVESIHLLCSRSVSHVEKKF